MLTLCIDTSYKYLTIVLMNDEKILAKYSKECFKGQSEALLPCTKDLFEKAKIKPFDIDAICIAKGPGSYTGVRIAMTLGKVICSLSKVKLYTISTLRLYAGGRPNTMVLLDARAKRAYVAIYDKERVILNDCVKELSDIDALDYQIVGDSDLLQRESAPLDIAENFLLTRDLWERVEDVDHLTPVYLKDNNAYLK